MGRQIRNGVLVAVEGIDGAGKTTQVQTLAARCQARGFEVVSGKEPTDGQWGRILRRSATQGRLPAQEELEFFLKDRREHVDQVIGPALLRRAVMILDRYYFSTIAYQSLRGLDPTHIRSLNEAFAPIPDLLVVLDLEPEVAVARINTRVNGANHFEHVHLLAASREVFLKCAADYPPENQEGRPVSALVLDATLAPEVIADRIEAALKVVLAEQIVAAKLPPRQALDATLRFLGSQLTP